MLLPRSDSRIDIATVRWIEEQPVRPTALPHPPLLAVRVRRNTVVRGLLLGVGLLLSLHLLVIGSFVLDLDFPRKMTFYFDREENLPTYFSSFLLLVAASLLALLAGLKRTERDPLTAHWLLLALVFVGLSLDETLSFHERLIEPLRQRYHTSGLLRFPWVIVGAGAVLGLGAIYLPFLWALARPIRHLMLAAAALYLGGALGLEMLGGYFYIDYNDFSAASYPYMAVMTLEETCEMLGVILFIHALLTHLKTLRPTFGLSFT